MPHRPAAPVVRSLVNGQQAAIGHESQRKGIAQSPGYQFQLRSIGVSAHDRCRAGYLSGNTLSSLGDFAEGRKSAGTNPRPLFLAERVVRLDAHTGEHDVISRNVMFMRQPPQPAYFIGIKAD